MKNAVSELRSVYSGRVPLITRIQFSVYMQSFCFTSYTRYYNLLLYIEFGSTDKRWASLPFFRVTPNFDPCWNPCNASEACNHLIPGYRYTISRRDIIQKLKYNYRESLSICQDGSSFLYTPSSRDIYRFASFTSRPCLFSADCPYFQK